MSQYNRFNSIVLLSVALVSLVLIVTSVYLESPTTGNLTRTAGFSENDYGWNQAQQYYDEALYTKNKQDYRFYSDVVILGDSFSQDDPQNNWVNYFVEATGLTTQVMHFNQGGVERLLTTAMFKDNPPKFFIFQSVESSLYGRASQKNCEVPKVFPIVDLPPVSLSANFNYSTHQVSREINHFNLDLDQASHYLLKALSRVIGINTSDTVPLKVSRTGMFSSQVKSKLLIHENDFEKQFIQTDSIHLMACNLLSIQRQVEANGYTRFVLMIAPDKLSAYSRELVNKQFASLSLIPALAASYSELSFIRLDILIQQEIDNGVVDIYLPNDTHWGSSGYRFAAESLIHYLNGMSQ